MTVRILGVCGSPIKGGNTELYLLEALKTAEELGDVETEAVLLADPKWENFRGCIHCNYCALRQKPDRFCAFDDPMIAVYPKIMEAHGLILASPVYLTRMSWLMAAFMDRLRAIGHGKLHIGSLKNKVGGAMAVTWERNSGAETTLLSMLQGMMLFSLIPVGTGLWGPYGATGLSSADFQDHPKNKHGVLADEYGMRNARELGRSVAGLAKVIQAGTEALRVSGQDTRCS